MVGRRRSDPITELVESAIYRASIVRARGVEEEGGWFQIRCGSALLARRLQRQLHRLWRDEHVSNVLSWRYQTRAVGYVVFVRRVRIETHQLARVA